MKNLWFQTKSQFYKVVSSIHFWKKHCEYLFQMATLTLTIRCCHKAKRDIMKHTNRGKNLSTYKQHRKKTSQQSLLYRNTAQPYGVMEMHNRLSWLSDDAKFHYNLLLFIRESYATGHTTFFSTQLQYPNHVHNYTTRFFHFLIAHARTNYLKKVVSHIQGNH